MQITSCTPQWSYYSLSKTTKKSADPKRCATHSQVETWPTPPATARFCYGNRNDTDGQIFPSNGGQLFDAYSFLAKNGRRGSILTISQFSLFSAYENYDYATSMIPTKQTRLM